MSGTRNRPTSRDFVDRDSVLSIRLRALGYSLERPRPATTSPDGEGVAASEDEGGEQRPTKNALQLFVDQVEETIARMKRVKEEPPVEEHCDAASSPVPYDSDSPSSSSSPEPAASDTASDEPNLPDLLRLVDGHKALACAAKEAKEHQKRRGKEPPPVTPKREYARKRADLRLDSLTAGAAVSDSDKKQAELSRDCEGPPTSPQKRLRRPSTPTTPSPPDLSATPTRSNLPGHLPLTPDSALRGSVSPKKRVTRHLPHFFALLSLSLRLVGACHSPLVDSATRVANLVPGITLGELIDLAQALRGDSALLALAYERTQAGGRTFESSLNFVGDHLFTSSPSKLPDPQRATLLLAKELGLYPPPPPLLAAPVAPASPRIISTSRSCCIQCGSSLNLHRRPTTPVYLVDPASPASLVLVAAHICTNTVCRTLHTPDHVELTHGGHKIWLWEEQPIAIKVGDRVWLSGAFARHYRVQLLEQATSAGAVASMWNTLYSVGTPLAAAEYDAADESSDSSEGEDEDEVRRRGKDAPAPFLLRQRHLWRAFVVHACILAAAASPCRRFASLGRPLTEHLVALANADLFSSPGGGACVLSPHMCDRCTRAPQRWRGGPATEDERAQGVRWTGTHAGGTERLAPHTKPVDGPDVQFAVCDGIEIGHPLCAAPACSNPPEAYRRSRRFCSSHVALHLVCGVVGCDHERFDDADNEDSPSEACALPAHQALWHAFSERRHRLEERGWTGRRGGVSAPRKYALPEVDEPDMQLWSDDDEEELEARGAGRRVSKLGVNETVAHTWGLRRTSNLQLLVGACGAPLAWTKFADGETAPEVVSFLSTVHKQLESAFPTYVAYDRACHVLRNILASPTAAASLPPFLSASRLVVTAFHKRTHPATDEFCDEFCTPTPLDGQAQDLVVPFRPVTRSGKFVKGSRRTFERAFNTSAAEQLNSTLSRFAPLLATLRADNFDFLVNVLLRYRREQVERRAA